MVSASSILLGKQYIIITGLLTGTHRNFLFAGYSFGSFDSELVLMGFSFFTLHFKDGSEIVTVTFTFTPMLS